MHEFECVRKGRKYILLPYALNRSWLPTRFCMEVGLNMSAKHTPVVCDALHVGCCMKALNEEYTRLWNFDCR